MITQPGGGRIDRGPNTCLTVDSEETSYITRSIKNRLFEVIFLRLEKSGNHIVRKDIIREVENEISETAFNDDKFFLRILEEVFQNIQLHSSFVVPPKFLLTKEKNQYLMEIDNFCTKENFERLCGFTAINSMSFDEVHAAYKKQMIGGNVSEKGCAGLGIYTVAQVAKKHLKNKKFPFITVEDLRTSPENISHSSTQKDLVHAKITIQIPFPERKNIINDHHMDS